LFTQWEHLGILFFAYHIGVVSYKTCFQNKIYVLDFKLSPCTECCMLSFGWIPGVWNLYADVLEHSVCPIFIGR